MFKMYEERNISWKWIGLKFTRKSASCYPWFLPSNIFPGFLYMFLLSNGIMEVPAPLEPRSLKDIDLAGLPCRALVGWTVRCQTQIPNWMVRINKSTKILSIRRISNRKICTCDSRCIYTYIHIYLYNWHHHTHIVFFDCRPVMPCLPCVTSVQTGLWTSGRETTLRGGGKCWETFGKINLKQSTFGIHMIPMIHQNPSNHTGITWRIFRAYFWKNLTVESSLFDRRCWSQWLLPTSNPCLLHWP